MSLRVFAALLVAHGTRVSVPAELKLGAWDTLVEASGLEDALAEGDEWAAAAGGSFCGNATDQLAIGTRSGGLLLLAGPSPHVVGELSVSESGLVTAGRGGLGKGQSTSWLAAASLDLNHDGIDELLLLCGEAQSSAGRAEPSQSVHVFVASGSCSGFSRPQPPVPLPVGAWVGLTAHPSLGDAGTAAVLLGADGSLLLLQPRPAVRGGVATHELVLTGEAAAPQALGQAWRTALTADLGGDGSAELVLARCGDGAPSVPPLVAAFAVSRATSDSDEAARRPRPPADLVRYELTRVAASSLAAAEGCTWLGAAAVSAPSPPEVGKQPARRGVVLLRAEQPRLLALSHSLDLEGAGSLAPPGAADPVAISTARLVSSARPPRPPPLGCLDGSDTQPQLIIVRAAAASPRANWSFRVDLEAWASRERHDPLRCLGETRAQAAWPAVYNESTGHMVPEPVEVPSLLRALNHTSTDTYKYAPADPGSPADPSRQPRPVVSLAILRFPPHSAFGRYIIWDDGDGSSYLRLVEILAATAGLHVAGPQTFALRLPVFLSSNMSNASSNSLILAKVPIAAALRPHPKKRGARR